MNTRSNIISPHSVSRRRFVQGAAMGALGFPGLIRASSLKSPPKIAVVGADGMDPTLLHKYAAAGLLPNCKKLIDAGGFSKLRTTVPPQSPVAWATFISGMDPGGHGIYDFITRDPSTRAPELSTASTAPPKNSVELGKYTVPLSSSKLELSRQGPAVWDVLQEAGVPSWALRAPVNYPPDNTKARSLCGLTTPDMHGSYGIFSFYTTDPSRDPGDVSGGSIERIRLQRGLAYCALRGPDNSFTPSQPRSEIQFTIERDADHDLVRIRIQEHDLLLKLGEWSDFIDVKFTMVPWLAEVTGICQFYVKEVRPQLQVYCSPVNIDPKAPAFPVSTPSDYSKEIVEQVGRYYTQGMAEATSALSQGVFSDAEFRQQATMVLEKDIEIFRSQLPSFKHGLFYAYFSSLDLNSHMFWRTIDPKHPLYTPELEKQHGDHLPSLYRKIDGFIGELMEHVGPEGQVFIASDHAFTSFRRQFNLNSWLLDNRYSRLKNRLDRDAAPNFANTDWSGTYAYGLGINSLFLNVKGREPDGIVNPGDEYEKLRDQLAAELCEARDPQTGEKPVRRVVKPEAVFRNTRGNPHHKPDLIVCYSDNYRASWDTILGGYPAEHVLDNKDAWSGDHCMDPDFLSGVLLTNAKIKADSPGLDELAPTILHAFNVPVPDTMAGRNLLA